MEPLFNILSQKKLKYGALKDLENITKIKRRTLRKWRSKLQIDACYRPYHNYCTKTFTDEVESNFASYLKSNFVDRNIPITRHEIQDMAIDIYNQCTPDSVRRCQFSASYN